MGWHRIREVQSLMGFLKWLLSAIFIDKDPAQKWADKDCKLCYGSGHGVGNAPGEWCFCAYRNCNNTISEAAQRQQQQPPQVRSVRDIVGRNMDSW